MAKRRQLRPEFDCPVCGETVPAGAKSCPECGACEKSGWKEGGEAYDGLDLSDDEFDYDKFASEEFGRGAPKSKSATVWMIAGIILFLALLVSFLPTCRG